METLKLRKEIIENYLNIWVDAGTWEWNDDETINVYGPVTIKPGITNMTKIPFKFKYVESFFDCSKVGLNTFENCPDVIGESFFCNDNKLETLDYFPKKAKEVWVYNNPGNFTEEDIRKICELGTVIVKDF